MELINETTETLYDEASIKTRIQKKLIEHKIIPEQLFEVMEKYNLYLSGSFLLQAISNDKFSGFDIDLFTFGEQDEYLECDVKKTFKFIKDLDIQFYNVQNEKIKYADAIYSILGINSVSTMDFGQSNYQKLANKNHKNILNKIQIIYINNNLFYDIKSFVNTFDFDICSNYYNGYDELYIKNLNGIINKKTIFTPSKTIMTNDQINEYLQKLKKIKNGNKVNKNEFPILNYGEYILTQRNISRIIKYFRRNYNFKINFYNNDNFELFDFVKFTEENEGISELMLNTMIATQLKLLGESSKLLILFDKKFTVSTIFNSLSSSVEKVILYNYSDSIIPFDFSNLNFPPALQEVRFFGIYASNDNFQIPYGCKIYFDNNLFAK